MMEHKLNVDPGFYMSQYCYKTDKMRISMMEKKSMPSVKLRRKALRAIRKGFIDKEQDNEGVTYQAGGF